MYWLIEEDSQIMTVMENLFQDLQTPGYITSMDKENWVKAAAWTLFNLNLYNRIDMNTLLQLAMNHILDTLKFKDRLHLLNLIYTKEDKSPLETIIFRYFEQFIIRSERFTGIVIEHFAGKLPGWLSPTQIKILTIGDVDEYVSKISSKLKKYRFEVDNRNIRLGEKIHDSKKQNIPITLIIGENDSLNNTMAINFLDSNNLKDIQVSEGIKYINKTLKKPVFKIL